MRFANRRTHTIYHDINQFDFDSDYKPYYFEGLFQLITIMQLYIHDPALDIPPRCKDSVPIADRPVIYNNT